MSNPMSPSKSASPSGGDIKDRVLAGTSLASLIGEHVSLTRRASHLVGCCPFHEEKTPSFYVYTDHYHCFGCGAHGDAISFVTKKQGFKFMEALDWLAKKYSIALPESDAFKQNSKEWKKRSVYQMIMQAAQTFFSKQLHEVKIGEKARDYLIARGFAAEDWTEFGFGYAPKGPSTLVHELKNQGFSLEDMEKCSLANVFSSRAYDFFQDRVIVPVRDPQGRLVAFGGRTLGDDPQKYKNSRYDKSSILFGMDRARKAMLAKGCAVVVEGYMDALQMWKHGFEETVASQGTALTHEHLSRLSQTVKSIFLLFDADQAGQKAAMRSFDLSFDFPSLFFKVVKLPQGEDPDSFLRKHGRLELEKELASAVDIFSFVLDFKLKQVSSLGQPELIRSEFIPWLAKIKDPIRKSYVIQKISGETGIETSLLQEQVRLHAGDTQEKPKAKKIQAAQEAVSDLPTSPIVLNQLQKELLGHLYFARPESFNLDEASAFLFADLQVLGEWSEWSLELIESLRMHKSPYEQELSRWVQAYSPQIEAFIYELMERSEAYKDPNKGEVLKRLKLEFRRKNLKQTLFALKNQALSLRQGQNSFQSQEWQEFSQSITRISLELNEIELGFKN